MVGSLLAVMIAAGATLAEPPRIDPATREIMDSMYRNCVTGCGLPYSPLCGSANKFSCLSRIHSCRVDCAMERTAIEGALSKQTGHE